MQNSDTSRICSNGHHAESGMGQTGYKLRLMKTRVVMMMTNKASGRTGDSEYLAFGKLEFAVAEDLDVELCICPQLCFETRRHESVEDTVKK